MFFRNIFILVLLLYIVQTAWAGVDEVWGIHQGSRGSVANYPAIASKLAGDGLYFTSVPYIKEYLLQSKKIDHKKMDQLIDAIVTQVGVKQFEVLPISVLEKTQAPIIKYILAKKYFRLGQYQKSLDTLKNSLSRNHPAKPFALLLEGSVLSILKKYDLAQISYNECIKSSNSAISDVSGKKRIRQLSINRDYCIVGVARAQFASGKFDNANLSYLDLPKSSHIWPEILFEEAWNSFYQRDYNRTLGKLVTYKAPFFTHIFNPEIDVLRALTYLELCLWGDTKKEVDTFYSKYNVNFNGLEGFLSKHGKDYKYYYLLANSYVDGKKSNNTLLNTLLNAIAKDSTYIEMQASFDMGKEEIAKLNGIKNNYLKKMLKRSLQEALLLQRNLIGAYVRKSLHLASNQIRKAFQDLSYMKLEVLRLKKNQIFGIDTSGDRNRGDIKNLVRTDKQYFWTFNGEFWADELGDYAFSLKSECN